jgi:hypothetical protein
MAYAQAKQVTIWRKGCGFDNDPHSMNDRKKFGAVEPSVYDLLTFLSLHQWRHAFVITVLMNEGPRTIWTKSHGFGQYDGNLTVSAFFEALRPNQAMPSERVGEYHFIANFEDEFKTQ